MGKSSYSKYVGQYDQWYDNNPAVYESELEAIRELVPEKVKGKYIEIGVGTGRFSSELGIAYGLDPEERMLEIAKSRGTECIKGVAEKLPLKSSSIELAVIVTSFCLMEGDKVLKEVYRMLAPSGYLIIAFVEKNSPLGEKYRRKASKSRFYKNVGFRSTEEIQSMLKRHGFGEVEMRQTLFKPMSLIKEAETPQKGHERGSFIVIRARCMKKA